MARAGEELTATLMNRDVVRIEGTVEWTIQPAEGGCYVGICDSLGLTLQADTWADMTDEIGNVQATLFRDLCAEGELDQFLTAHGWRAIGDVYEGAVFDLPFLPQLVAASDDSASLSR